MMHFVESRRRAAALRCAFAALLMLGSFMAAAAEQQFPRFPDPRLSLGRTIWLNTCEACHAHDLAGAPLVTDKKAWAPRVAKGVTALYESALGGLTGAKGTQMPPRGGNAKLTDDEVKAAVDYIVAIVR